MTTTTASTMMSLEWRRNDDGMWAWFDGADQVTGARGEIGSGRSHAVLDSNGEGIETACGALPGETVAAYVLRGHGLDPDRYVNGDLRKKEPATEPTLADHPEFLRLAKRYGHLSLAEMDALIGSMQAEALSLLAQHRREFNGNGGRRYRPAMATQAGREIGSERLLLCAFRAFKGSAEASGLTEPIAAPPVVSSGS